MPAPELWGQGRADRHGLTQHHPPCWQAATLAQVGSPACTQLAGELFQAVRPPLGAALPGGVTQASTAPQLKAALKQWGLPVTGNKATLWQRLQDEVDGDMGAGYGLQPPHASAHSPLCLCFVRPVLRCTALHPAPRPRSLCPTSPTSPASPRPARRRCATACSRRRAPARSAPPPVLSCPAGHSSASARPERERSLACASHCWRASPLSGSRCAPPLGCLCAQA